MCVLVEPGSCTLHTYRTDLGQIGRPLEPLGKYWYMYTYMFEDHSRGARISLETESLLPCNCLDVAHPQSVGSLDVARESRRQCVAYFSLPASFGISTDSSIQTESLCFPCSLCPLFRWRPQLAQVKYSALHFEPLAHIRLGMSRYSPGPH